VIKKNFFPNILFLLIIQVYYNTLLNKFVFDDEHFVQKNIYLQDIKYLPSLLTQNIIAGSGIVSNLYRPLQSFTHFIDVQIWGMNPFGHHLSNLIFCLMMAFALFSLLKKTFDENIALAGTLLFCLHPMQSEAVAYVSGRGDILAYLFLFLTLNFFNRRPYLAGLFSLLAMMSKESMALMPVYIFAYHWMMQEKFQVKKYLPVVLVSAFYIISRLTWLNFNNILNFYSAPNIFTENISYRIYTYFTTVAGAFRLWFSPYDLHHERSWPVYVNFLSRDVLIGLGLLVSIFLLGWFELRKNKRSFLLPALLWFLVASFPTSNIIVLINAIFYDHWFILPGFLFLMTIIFYLKKYPIFLYAMVIAFALITRYYNTVWENPFTLYNHILKYEPNSAKAHNNIAMAYSDIGELNKAIEHYQLAIKISDTYAETHHNLANLYLNQEKYQEALIELNLALKINSQFAPSQNMRNNILKKFPNIENEH
jgi:hypothetical protein